MMNTLNQSKLHATPQPAGLSSVLPKLSNIGPLRAIFTGILVAASLAAAAAAPAWADSETRLDPVELQKWRAVMAQIPQQEPGCFHESYPNTAREKVDCRVARLGVHPVHHMRAAGGPDIVGNSADYAAETKGKTFWAGGSFLDVTVGSEASVGVQAYGDQGILGSNEYSLQINTNNGQGTSACGHSTTFDCHVWQQYVYATDYDCDVWGCGGAVFIQYWLLDYGQCPSGWNQESSGSSNCYVNSDVVSAPDFPVSDLQNLSLHASASAGGQDCAVVYNNTGDGWGICAGDGVLDISSVWDQTEFGIFGDSGGSQAAFGFGTSFAQLLQVNDGSGAAPKCLSNAGTTGETNNLNAGKCQPLTGNGLYPRIRFVESNPFESPPAPTVSGAIASGHGLTPGHSWRSQDGRFTLSMQTDSNLVLYEGDTALWNTGTVGQHVAFMIMQADGNLVLYNTSEKAVWSSGTPGYETASLAIQNDGNLVIYYKSRAIWNSGTAGH